MQLSKASFPCAGPELDRKPTDRPPPSRLFSAAAWLLTLSVCVGRGGLGGCFSVGLFRYEIGSSNPLAHKVNRTILSSPFPVSRFLIIIKLVTLVMGRIKVTFTEL